MYLVQVWQFFVLKNTTAAWAILGHGVGHAWQFGSLILTVIKILKLELLQC